MEFRKGMELIATICEKHEYCDEDKCPLLRYEQTGERWCLLKSPRSEDVDEICKVVEDSNKEGRIMSRLDAKQVNNLQFKRMQDLVVNARCLEHFIQKLCPDGREREIALQYLEEVVMWANKAISREGVTND